MKTDNVAIIGSGLAGLNCALALQAAGVPFEILEANDHIGGRVASDVIDGFILDRGFQVILDSYPEAQKALDFAELGHQGFEPGALVRHGARFWRVVDPWRSFFKGLASINAPFMSISDGLKMSTLRSRALSGSHNVEGQTAAQLLKDAGLSEKIMDGFFRPFFRGVTLDPELGVSASYFLSLFGWFATGTAGLPKAGMKAIPEQLAAKLPADCIHLNQRVSKIEGTTVTLESGESKEAKAVILATDFANAAKILGQEVSGQWLAATTLYFAADSSPIEENLLVINGDPNDNGPINHLCVLNNAQPSYAPEGQSLISATALGDPKDNDEVLEQRTRDQMKAWYGDQVDSWRLLKVDRIREALPAPQAGSSDLNLAHGVFRCGDYLVSPSIQGSFESGRLTGEAVASWLKSKAN